MDQTIQVNIREYISMKFTIKWLLQIILHKKIQKNTKSDALSHLTNDEWRSQFRVAIYCVKNFVSEDFLFPILVWFPPQLFVKLTEILCI